MASCTTLQELGLQVIPSPEQVWQLGVWTGTGQPHQPHEARPWRFLMPKHRLCHSGCRSDLHIPGPPVSLLVGRAAYGLSEMQYLECIVSMKFRKLVQYSMAAFPCCYCCANSEGPCLLKGRKHAQQAVMNVDIHPERCLRAECCGYGGEKLQVRI